MSQLLNHYFNNICFLLYMRHFHIFHTLLTIGHHGNLRKRNKETRERPPRYLTLLLFVWWLFLKSWNMWNTYLAKSLYVLSLPIRNWISHLFLFWEYITFFFLNRHVKIRKWRDQKSVQRIWVVHWGWGSSCGFTVSPWSRGCLTIPASSHCSIQDILSTEPISSEKLTDSSKKPEGIYLTSFNPMPLKIVWR